MQWHLRHAPGLDSGCSLAPEATLNREGFALRLHPAETVNFCDDGEVVERCYPETVCDAAFGGPAKCSLHSAFDDPGTPVGAATRESIEVRVMAFW